MTSLKARAFSVVFMFALCAIFAGGLSVIKASTAEKVADNQKIADLKNLVAVFELMDDPSMATGAQLEQVLASSVHTFTAAETESGTTLTESALDKPTSGAISLWVLVDKNGQPQAYAFPVGGRGFWGPIEGVLSVEADGETIRTVVWTKHGETPGLGARIEEDQYREKFRGKKAIDSSNPANPKFKVVGEGTMYGQYQVDGITGATQTTIIGLGGFLPKNFETWHRLFPQLQKKLNAAQKTTTEAIDKPAPDKG